MRDLLLIHERENFVWKQVVAVCVLIDWEDEASRRLLSVSVRQALDRYFYNNETVQLAMTFLKRCYPREEDFARYEKEKEKKRREREREREIF
jgi:hypothetical protein